MSSVQSHLVEQWRVADEVPVVGGVQSAVAQAKRYPHLRYMGSKYRLLSTLASVFDQVGGVSAAGAASWTSVGKFAAVLEVEALNGVEAGEYFRSRGSAPRK